MVYYTCWQSRGEMIGSTDENVKKSKTRSRELRGACQLNVLYGRFFAAHNSTKPTIMDIVTKLVLFITFLDIKSYPLLGSTLTLTEVL